jgi:hypothetical protein
LITVLAQNTAPTTVRRAHTTITAPPAPTLDHHFGA